MIEEVRTNSISSLDKVASIFDKLGFVPSSELISKKLKPNALLRARSEMDQ